MKVRVVQKGNKYVKKYSLDVVDWIGLLIVLAILCVVGINMLILRG